MLQEQPETTVSERSSELGGRIARLASILGSDGFPSGDRAALRKMNPDQPPLRFFGFAVRHLPESWERDLQEWTTLVAAMAIMAPVIHEPARGLGKALAEANYSEGRLERLLTAAGATRRTLLLRAARFLAAKRSACDFTDMAQLLLTRNPEKQQRLCLRIAKDFYRTLDQLA